MSVQIQSIPSSFVTDGKYVFVGTLKEVKVLDIIEGSEVFCFPPLSSSITTLSVGENPFIVVVGAEDGSLTIYKIGKK